MRRPPDPDEQRRIRDSFDSAANMPSEALAVWLETEESRRVGFFRRGATESVGHWSGRRILEIRARPDFELTEGDYAHMRKVVGYVRRHRAQRPRGDVTHTRWRWSLMNWGHDPLRDPAPEG